jgi:hypothetical protein
VRQRREAFELLFGSAKDRCHGRHAPVGVRDYVKSNGFHTVYLAKPLRGWPIKVGIAEDPVQRLLGLQNAHYEELAFHRFWWLPGSAVALRIETAFKKDFAANNIRGEWFELKPTDAVNYVEAAIDHLGIWSLKQSEMEYLYDDWVRKRWGVPKHAPSPLSGRAPRKSEKWQTSRKKRSHKRPSLPSAPWEEP